MKKEDTLDHGPNKLLLKRIDLENYQMHIKKLAKIGGENRSFGDGSHIKKINDGKTLKL